MAKAKATSAPVTANIETKEKAEFLSFYNKAAKEKETPLIRVADAVTGIVGCEVEFESIMKWDKDASKAVFSYIKITIKKPIDGEFVGVKELLIGHNVEHNTKWVMVCKPEVEAPKVTAISC